MYGLTAITVAVFNLLAALFLRYVPIALLLAIVLAGQAMVLAIGPLAATDWTGILVLVAYGAFAGVTPTCLFGLPGLLLGPGGRRPGCLRIHAGGPKSRRALRSLARRLDRVRRAE